MLAVTFSRDGDLFASGGADSQVIVTQCLFYYPITVGLMSLMLLIIWVSGSDVEDQL